MDKIRVLLADDHELVREGTRALLERETDIEVVGEAADGEEAVRLATQLRPDVIIMDVAMPRLNGIEATKQIKAIEPSTGILVVSAYDNDQYVFALLEAGAAGYLLKNVRGREVVAAVRAVHAGEAVLHPAIARKVFDYFSSPQHKQREQARAEHLSERELDILRLAARGYGNKDIAEQLFLSARTVQAHLANIFRKMEVGSRTEAVLKALRNGLISLEDTN